MWDTFVAHLAEVIGLVGIAVLLTVAAWLRQYIARRPPSLRRFNEASNTIHSLLIEARVLTKADRAFVVQFRNGDRFDIEAPVFRLYVTHEVVNRGIAPVTLAWSDMMASQFNEVLTPLFTDKATLPCVLCRDAGECDRRKAGTGMLLKVTELQEGAVKSMLIQQGTDTLLIAPLLDREHLVGMVVADFRTRLNETTDEQCAAVCNAAHNIAYELRRAVVSTSGVVTRIWHAVTDRVHKV